MNRSLLACALSGLFLVEAGCSSQLSRKQAQQVIEAALQKHAAAPTLKRASTGGGIPGLDLYEEGECSVDTFRLGRQPALSSDDPSATLYDALARFGYISIRPASPGEIDVEMLAKAGTTEQSNGKTIYTAGFRCFETVPGDTRCLMPPMLTIHPSGIEVRQVHMDRDDMAEVRIRVPWELTPMAREMKDYVETLPDVPYAPYWQRAIRGHAPSGSTPTSLSMRRTAKGWQIVDPTARPEMQMATTDK